MLNILFPVNLFFLVFKKKKNMHSFQLLASTCKIPTFTIIDISFSPYQKNPTHTSAQMTNDRHY